MTKFSETKEDCEWCKARKEDGRDYPCNYHRGFAAGQKATFAEVEKIIDERIAKIEREAELQRKRTHGLESSDAYDDGEIDGLTQLRKKLVALQTSASTIPSLRDKPERAEKQLAEKRRTYKCPKCKSIILREGYGITGHADDCSRGEKRRAKKQSGAKQK